MQPPASFQKSSVQAQKPAPARARQGWLPTQGGRFLLFVGTLIVPMIVAVQALQAGYNNAAVIVLPLFFPIGFVGLLTSLPTRIFSNTWLVLVAWLSYLAIAMPGILTSNTRRFYLVYLCFALLSTANAWGCLSSL